MRQDLWTPEEDAWLRANYADRSIDLSSALPGRTRKSLIHRAGILGLSRPVGVSKGNPGRKRIFEDEELICTQYKELKSLKRVAELYGASEVTISNILKKNGIKPSVRPSRIEPYKEEIIADYKAGKMSTVEMGVKYNISNDALTLRLKHWGIYDPAKEFVFINRKSFYQCWVEAHGKEEADRRYKAYYENHMRTRRRGKDNNFYGKPTPQGAGNGWKGWYKGTYFRSLREVTFMIEMDSGGISWEAAETICIPYTFMGEERFYRPDYLVGNRLIEIKPKRLHQTPRVIAKQIGAIQYCAERGMTYELLDVEINAKAIHKTLQSGLVRFDRDYEARFIAYITHNP